MSLRCPWGGPWVAAGLAVSLAFGLTEVGAAETWDGLRGVHRLPVEVELSAEPPALTAESLRNRIAAMLDGRPRGPFVDPGSPDRLRLTVGVRPYGATELRGFWLPFSGTYGVGPVRLGIERPVALAGGSSPVPAVVWQAERQAAGPWAKAAATILARLEELITVFLADHRRANS